MLVTVEVYLQAGSAQNQCVILLQRERGDGWISQNLQGQK